MKSMQITATFPGSPNTRWLPLTLFTAVLLSCVSCSKEAETPAAVSESSSKTIEDRMPWQDTLDSMAGKMVLEKRIAFDPASIGAIKGGGLVTGTYSPKALGSIFEEALGAALPSEVKPVWGHFSGKLKNGSGGKLNTFETLYYQVEPAEGLSNVLEKIFLHWKSLERPRCHAHRSIGHKNLEIPELGVTFEKGYTFMQIRPSASSLVDIHYNLKADPKTGFIAITSSRGYNEFHGDE